MLGLYIRGFDLVEVIFVFVIFGSYNIIFIFGGGGERDCFLVEFFFRGYGFVE